MPVERVDASEIARRLAQYPELERVLGQGWLQKELSKPEERWSLLTGWLSTADP